MKKGIKLILSLAMGCVLSGNILANTKASSVTVASANAQAPKAGQVRLINRCYRYQYLDVQHIFLDYSHMQGVTRIYPDFDKLYTIPALDTRVCFSGHIQEFCRSSGTWEARCDYGNKVEFHQVS